jgi:hypothetical protein
MLMASAWSLTLAQIAVRDQGFVPFSDAPINYRTDPVDDPVARLQKRIDSREVRLAFDPQHGRGYLKSVLDALHVPVSSQALVFSKSSFQYKKISPQTPRALYFNDDVYVGWVNEGRALELVSFDARQGAMFYLLDQEQEAAHPRFERAELDCTQCHVAANTRGVPGVLVRSIFTTPKGTQAAKAPSFLTGHESALKDRFGGWYVTGTTGRQVTMANALVTDPEHPDQIDRAGNANATDLSARFDTSAYLSAHSDIVAQLVQQHQTQMHNLITLTNYRTRIALHAAGAAGGAAAGAAPSLTPEARAQFEGPAEELVRYLLFVNEAPLEDAIAGTSGFAEEFAARGPRDARGRSLREFDLRTRLFKYPCSYLIYSEAFDALPEPAKTFVYHRLFEILTGRDQRPEFARLTAADRRAILDILRATKPGLPAEWKTQS